MKFLLPILNLTPMAHHILGLRRDHPPSEQEENPWPIAQALPMTTINSIIGQTPYIGSPKIRFADSQTHADDHLRILIGLTLPHRRILEPLAR